MELKEPEENPVSKAIRTSRKEMTYFAIVLIIANVACIIACIAGEITFEWVIVSIVASIVLFAIAGGASVMDINEAVAEKNKRTTRRTRQPRYE